MNCQEPFRISNIDLSNVSYTKIKSNKNKKIVLLKYNNKNKLKNFVFQTPTLLNISQPQHHENYSELDIALVGKEKNKVNKFIKFLNNIENKIKMDAQYNANLWFNLNENNQSVTFQKIIRESDDYENGIIKIKVIKNNDFETALQLNNNKKINITNIPENSWCKMLLECYAVWINSNNDFGIFFRPVLISFTPIEKELYNYTFIDDSENEIDDIPDTDINNNVFLEINNKQQHKDNDSTSQLEINQLIGHLENESIINDDNLLSIDLKNNYSSSTNSSSSDYDNDENINDAETSD